MTRDFVRPIGATCGDTMETALELSPYLASLERRYGFLDGEFGALGAEALFRSALARLNALPDDVEPSELMRLIRVEKSRAHFALAALDLSFVWPVTKITQALTDLADCCVATALRCTAHTLGLNTTGIAVFALGKMGAGELNYSSDIDMAVFYDAEEFDGGDRGAEVAAVRLTQETMRVLEERTADGYGFRTDLRLRPDPSSNPLAVSVSRADVYYESVGQNWERMVWIKGRPAAGDLETAARLQKIIDPFVWRKHLDYWAIADVRAIKAMINAKMQDLSADEPSCDIKLGPGGIREIEFFAQTQQIILGGRNPDLRVRDTLGVLDQLVAAGALDEEIAAGLNTAYQTLRHVEHRIQMRSDEQTHTLPGDPDVRLKVAALCGVPSLADFDRHVFETRQFVNCHYLNLFSDDQSSAGAAVGNLVFTGVDDDPGTVQTLMSLGFEDPARVIHTFRQWHRARTPATRSPRGRELLTALTPHILQQMSGSGEADRAFSRFQRFFEGLRSGVQTLSMLQAEPRLLDDLIATLSLAPQIADTLARRPSLLETLLSVNDRAPQLQIRSDVDFEDAMVATRRWQGEQAFQTGHKLLHGQISAREAAGHWTRLADQTVIAMSAAAEAETVRRFGPPPGQWSVLALGKLGGREMTAGSDLDLLVVYDPLPDQDAQLWFTRFTQRLIAGLSAETGDGYLYEVDMRLRPSGRAGPVATSITAFERYHREEAWTWEHMALTRLRAISGDRALGQTIVAIANKQVSAPRDPDAVTADILDMRQRLAREKPPKSMWDLKMSEGGLIDVEFVVQHGLLLAGDIELADTRLSTAIPALGAAGHLSPQDAQTLSDSYTLLQALQQVQRLSLGDNVTTGPQSEGLRDRFARALGLKTFGDVETALLATYSAVRKLRINKIGSVATE